MEGIGNYLIGVISAGFLCSIAKTLGPKKGTAGALIQTLCGVVLLLALFGPLGKITAWDLGCLPEFSLSGENAAAAGEAFAKDALEAGIKQRSEAYILDKAALYGASVEVEVKIEWKETPVPAKAVIRGSCSPYAKRQLTVMMEQDLGIPEKDQLWVS